MPNIKADKGLGRETPPVGWQAVLTGVPREFNREEKISARRWDLCILAELYPNLSEKIINEKTLTKKEKQLMQLSLAFGCAVNRDDFEEAETIYSKMKGNQ